MFLPIVLTLNYFDNVISQNNKFRLAVKKQSDYLLHNFAKLDLRRSVLPRIYLFLALVLWSVSVPLVAAPKLTITSGSEMMVLDRDELESFPQTHLSTTSPYYEGVADFSGPTLARVLDTFGVSEGTQITLVALNDYKVSGSLEELLKLDAIVATRRDARVMSVRDRGPFWVILPLSERPELDNEHFHRYMIWQLSRIEVN